MEQGEDGGRFPAAGAALISPFGIIHRDINASETVPSRASCDRGKSSASRGRSGGSEEGKPD